MTHFPNNARVIFTGDSLVAHANFPLRVMEHYRRNLSELDVKFFSAAAGGAQLRHGIAFFEEEILPFEPTHMVINYGGNDAALHALNHTDPVHREQVLSERTVLYKENLQKMIDLARSHGIEPIFMTPATYGELLPLEKPALAGGHKRMAEFAEYVREACIKNGVGYFDIHARSCELYMHEDFFSADRVHPTDYGEYLIAAQILREQGLEAGEFVPHAELLTDEFNAEWHKNCYRFGRIFGAYVNLAELELYEKPVDEQMHIVEEYVITRGYGEVNSKRDYSTEFVIFKPQEKTFIDNLRRLNEDEV